MPEHTVADRLRSKLQDKTAAIIAANDASEGVTPLPAPKPKKKPKKKEKIGVGINDSNKKANAILVTLSAKMQTALDAGAKPGSMEITKLRNIMHAINQTRIK